MEPRVGFRVNRGTPEQVQDKFEILKRTIPYLHANLAPFFFKFFTLILLKKAFKVMSDLILSFMFVIKGL